MPGSSTAGSSLRRALANSAHIVGDELIVRNPLLEAEELVAQEQLQQQVSKNKLQVLQKILHKRRLVL